MEVRPRVFSTRNASLVLFGIGTLLVIAAIVLSLVPPPPGKANTGAPIWVIWALFIFFFGFAVRWGNIALRAVAAVIALAVAMVNVPDLSGFWQDFAPNALASVVVLGSCLAFAGAIAAMWTSRHAPRVGFQ